MSEKLALGAPRRHIAVLGTGVPAVIGVMSTALDPSRENRPEERNRLVGDALLDLLLTSKTTSTVHPANTISFDAAHLDAGDAHR